MEMVKFIFIFLLFTSAVYTNTVFEKVTLGNRNRSFLDLCDDGYKMFQWFLFKPGGNCGPR